MTDKPKLTEDQERILSAISSACEVTINDAVTALFVANIHPAWAISMVIAASARNISNSMSLANVLHKRLDPDVEPLDIAGLAETCGSALKEAIAILLPASGAAAESIVDKLMANVPDGTETSQ